MIYPNNFDSNRALWPLSWGEPPTHKQENKTLQDSLVNTATQIAHYFHVKCANHVLPSLITSHKALSYLDQER